MNLLGQPIQGYFQGVVDIVQENNGLRLLRMTPAQLGYYSQTEGWAIRSRCNSGVLLGLCTNTRSLDIKMEALSGARSYFGLDVEIDGILSHAVRLDSITGVFEQRLFEFEQQKEREIRIYFSPNIEMKLLEIGLETSASATPLESTPSKLLCLGDSITQGMDALSPCSTYPVQLARLLNAELLNQGVGGHIFDVDSLDETLPYKPSLITVAYGTNDWGRGIGLDGIRRTATAYLQKLRAIYPVEQTKIVVLSPIWRETGQEKKGNVTLPELGQEILNIASEIHGIIPFDGAPLVPHQPWYLVDGTHPNDLGFLHYGLNLYRLLKNLL